MNRLIALLLSSVFAMAFLGCSPRNTGTPAGGSPIPLEGTPGDVQENPYPEPATPEQRQSGYPEPLGTVDAANLPRSITIPSPEAGQGTVTGTLLFSGEGAGPYYATLILAGTTDSGKAGYPPTITFSVEEDPVAVQDQTGKFLFDNIPPGSYALVIWDPPVNPIIQNPDSDEYLIFDVVAGEITDLGEVFAP
jgi:hypothetical protein